MQEFWRTIDGFVKYEVSNLGNVRRIGRKDNLKIQLVGTTRKPSGKKMKGYSGIRLNNKNLYVHRLVAFAFLNESYFTGAVVNHKDEDTFNNNVDNLEWITINANINYGTRNKRISNALSGRHWEETNEGRIEITSEEYNTRVQNKLKLQENNNKKNKNILLICCTCCGKKYKYHKSLKNHVSICNSKEIK